MKRKISTNTNTSSTSTTSIVLSSTATTISTISSKVYHLFFSPIEGIINNIDNDVLKKIMSYLPLKDLNLQRLVSIFPRGIYTEKYETLGNLVHNTEIEPKVIEDDKTLMQLCDENGEVLDFSTRGKAFNF